MNLRIDDRAGGVLLGMGVADGWSTATELALCVGDAAATGLALTDASALGLLGRNLRELRLEPNGSAAGVSSSDDILAAAAIVALAHLHDTPHERADAARAVIAAVDAQTVVGDDILRWVEVVADSVREGALPDDPGERQEDSDAGTTAGSIRAAMQAVRAAEHTGGTDSERFAAALAAGSVAPAATGALFGARFGWQGIPSELADQAWGWPDAGSTALIGLGVLAARPHPRSAVPDSGPASEPAERFGGTVPIERWDELSENSTSAMAHDDAGGSSLAWRRSQIVLTTADADPNSEPTNDRRAGA